MGKFVVVVMDSAGIGAMPDAADFGDAGADTFGNVERMAGGLRIPHLRSLGIAHIDGVSLLPDELSPKGCYGKAAELFPGKDTTGGHWELAGLTLKKPFDTFPEGFPSDILQAFCAITGKQVLGNKAASGTEILVELGEEHCETGCPILYTSADSVFQIACHKDVVPLEELYEICRATRNMLNAGPHQIGRVIARPFIGDKGNYLRTSERRDYSIIPPGDTILDAISARGYQVAAVGKIEDIFCNRGITKSNHTINNMAGVDGTIRYLYEDFDGMIFTNLMDFDSLYGHRNDWRGYAKALEEFDQRIPELMEAMGEEDILLLTADHGCDPTLSHSTDHTREYIPILLYGKQLKKNYHVGTRMTFSDIGATIAMYFGIDWPVGQSFLSDIREE